MPTPRDRPGEVVDSRADLGDDARALVSAQNGKARHRDVARHQVMVGAAHPSRFHLDLDFVLARVADFDLFDGPWLVELPDQCALGLHRKPAFIVELRLRVVPSLGRNADWLSVGQRR